MTLATSTALASPEAQAFVAGFPIMVLQLAITLTLFAIGMVVFAALSPWKEAGLVRDRNLSATVTLSMAGAGLALTLAANLGAAASVGEVLLWGTAAVIIQLLLFRTCDLVFKGLPPRIRENDMPAGVFLGSLRLAMALMLAAALAG